MSELLELEQAIGERDAPRAVVLATTWHARAADWLRENHGEEAVRTTDLLAGLSPALRG